MFTFVHLNTIHVHFVHFSWKKSCRHPEYTNNWIILFWFIYIVSYNFLNFDVHAIDIIKVGDPNDSNGGLIEGSSRSEEDASNFSVENDHTVAEDHFYLCCIEEYNKNQ